MQFENHLGATATCPNGFIRRYPRALFSVPVSLHPLRLDEVRTWHGITLDIGEGGVGALVQGSLSVGETVGIDLLLPENRVSTVAIVRYSSPVRSGFEFVSLTAEERLQIVSATRTS